MSEPDYGGLNIPNHLDRVAKDLQDWLDGETIDVLTVNRCKEESVIPFLKNMSKLSSLISVEIESMALNRVSNYYGNELPQNVEWMLNERVAGEKYPDLALTDLTFDPPSNWVWPGVEIKAWCPFATEITGRMKKGQSIMEQYPDKLLLVAWVPENLLYGKPKVVGTWLGDGSDMAESRDDYWFNAPKSIILEPDFSPERDPSEQHTNVDRFLWDDDNSKLDEARELARELGISNSNYSYDEEFQRRVRRLYSEYNYNHGTNFRKLARLHYDPLDNFPDNLRESTYIEGKSLQEWDRHLSNENPEPFRKVLQTTQSTL